MVNSFFCFEDKILNLANVISIERFPLDPSIFQATHVTGGRMAVTSLTEKEFQALRTTIVRRQRMAGNQR